MSSPKIPKPEHLMQAELEAWEYVLDSLETINNRIDELEAQFVSLEREVES